jgi:hypothetical protein
MVVIAYGVFGSYMSPMQLKCFCGELATICYQQKKISSKGPKGYSL